MVPNAFCVKGSTRKLMKGTEALSTHVQKFTCYLGVQVPRASDDHLQLRPVESKLRTPLPGFCLLLVDESEAHTFSRVLFFINLLGPNSEPYETGRFASTKYSWDPKRGAWGPFITWKDQL